MDKPRRALWRKGILASWRAERPRQGVGWGLLPRKIWWATVWLRVRSSCVGSML